MGVQMPHVDDRQWNKTLDRLHDLEAQVVRMRHAALDQVADLVGQYAHRSDDGKLFTGGLSTLEDAFEFLRIPDPCPARTWDRLCKRIDALGPKEKQDAAP
jgi:hypothetical protein